MSWPKRRVVHAAILLVPAVWLAKVLLDLPDRFEVARMTETMRPVCVGRFLIDLPASARFSLRRAFVEGFDINIREESEQQFNARVAARGQEINRKRNRMGGRNLELARNFESPGVSGTMFVFGRERIHWREGDRRKSAESIAIHGLVHAKGVSYDFVTDSYYPERVGQAERLISKLMPNPDNGIPTVPGFCIDRAVMVAAPARDWVESVVLFAGLSGHRDLTLAFSTMAGTAPSPGLIERNAAAAAGDPFYIRAMFTTLRERNRTINGLAGEELALRIREFNWTTGYSLDWEMGGKRDNAFLPHLHLELSTGVSDRSGDKPVQSSLSQDAVLMLWDKMAGSIRAVHADARKQT